MFNDWRKQEGEEQRYCAMVDRVYCVLPSPLAAQPGTAMYMVHQEPVQTNALAQDLAQKGAGRHCCRPKAQRTETGDGLWAI